MPKLNPVRVQQNKKLAEKASALYKKGISLREVGNAIGKSYGWVWKALEGIKQDHAK